MRYGILAKTFWNSVEEGYPEGSICIVLLDENGYIAIDELVEEIMSWRVGAGHVYSNDRDFLGYIAVDLDATVLGAFETVGQALDYAGNMKSELDEINARVNAQLAENRMIDAYVDNEIADRNLKWFLYAVICILILAILAVLYESYLRYSTATPFIPSPTRTITAFIGLWAGDKGY